MNLPSPYDLSAVAAFIRDKEKMRRFEMAFLIEQARGKKRRRRSKSSRGGRK